ncbi:MAG: hypothetical protein M3371_07325, partial [Acidobacteriota bacterium]|nr:hypothetical protein [Acidobacteriota bacterium]
MSSPGLFRPRRIAAMSVPLPPAIRIPPPYPPRAAVRPRRAVDNPPASVVVPLPAGSLPRLSSSVPVAASNELPDVGSIPTPLPPGMARQYPSLLQPVPVVAPNELPDVGMIPTPLPPGMAERDRYAQGEPDRATRLQESIAYESTAPLQKMGRGRAFLSMA